MGESGFKIEDIVRIGKLSKKLPKYNTGLDYKEIREHYKKIRPKLQSQKEAVFDCIIQYGKGLYSYRQMERIIFGR